MEYSSSKWKHVFRSVLYKSIPPGLYISVMPAYFKLFNKKRRGCTYRFKAEDKGRIVLFDDATRFYFMGYRRINRYLYPDGLGRKISAMEKKYCIAGCSIEKGDIVVEIGANVGEFTLMASRNASRVYSFEPDPSCFYCLNENTRATENVEVIHNAASDKNSSQVFYVSSEDADSSLIQPKTYSQKIEINTIRLDSWMESRELLAIDFLKIEAEGAEMEVLKGLGDKIQSVKKVSVDGGPERYGEPTSQDVDQFLRLHGFQTQVIGYHVYGWKK